MARRGVLVQRLDAIEALARADRLFVDKTGTLTEECPQLADVKVVGALDREQALARAASLASWSRHPTSLALVAAAGEHRAGVAWREVDEQPGLGLAAVDPGGRRWRLGSAAWLGTRLPGQAQAGLSCDGALLAAFEFDETLREGAADAIAALQRDGMRITLLSGDTPARTSRLAARLALEGALGGALPEDKLAAVAAAQQRGERVAMLGDGLNDAPVLARADVSLAMGQGALVSRAGADAVIVSNRPADLVRARRTARRALAIAHQNIAWAALYNVAAIPLAVAGWLPPWAAGLGMAASSLLVVGNSLRAAR
jgi:Cu2+-exporting ATPase